MPYFFSPSIIKVTENSFYLSSLTLWMASEFIASGRRLDHRIGRISLTCGLFLDNLDIWISVFHLLYLVWPFLFHIKLEWKPGTYNSRTFAFLLRKEAFEQLLMFIIVFSLIFFSPLFFSHMVQVSLLEGQLFFTFVELASIRTNSLH